MAPYHSGRDPKKPNFTGRSGNGRGMDSRLRRVVDTAIEVGTYAAQTARKRTKAAQNQTFPSGTYRTSQRSSPQPELPVRYANTDGRMALGIAKIVGGSLLGALTFLLTLAALILTLTGEGILTFLLMLALFGSNVGLIVSGVKNLGQVKRFKTYCKLLGTRTQCGLEQLARGVGKPEAYVRADIKKMINKGLFLEGHLDREETTLITSHETYRSFEESRLQLEQRQRQQALEQAQAAQAAAQEAARKAAQPPQIQEVLQEAEAYLAKIRSCNDAIPGQVISEKIHRMELILRQIFQRLEADPETLPDLKKLMDYYLPTTVKLLEAYADMDAQPIAGQTIAASKQEIEQTLDTLNLAFEKLLDSIFQETAMDVSSDISVLHTLLAQEGLTEDELTRMKKQKNL